MKTVRLSSQLTWDIRNNAEKKFDNANPSKDYPKDGFDVLKSEKILDKIQKTETMFKEIWSMAMPTETIDELQIKATFCLLYTSPSPRDRTRSRMPSSA